MAWKQDLAKLKEQLGPEPPAPTPKRPPKPAPRPGGPVPLDDEDAVFLSAMGLKPAARPVSPMASQGPTETPAVVEAKAPETFMDAIKDLKGLKPISRALPDKATPPPAAPAALTTPKPSPAPALPQVPIPTPPEPIAVEAEALVQPIMPLRFQLAAGMAIEVDGSLDLRGHSLTDAMGSDPILHDGLLALLASGQVPMVARYAQAPVPMGGTQAWLLYLGPPPVQA